jgi:hypothetical protein
MSTSFTTPPLRRPISSEQLRHISSNISLAATIAHTAFTPSTLSQGRQFETPFVFDTDPFAGDNFVDPEAADSFPTQKPLLQSLAIDTAEVTDFDFDPIFNLSELSLTDEPAAKAPCVKSSQQSLLGSLTSLLSFPNLQGITSTPRTAAVASASALTVESKPDFLLGGPAVVEPVEMLRHDQLLLESLTKENPVAKVAPQKQKKPFTTASRKPFKVRESKEQREKRYSDTRKTNAMLKSSISEARHALKQTLDILILLEKDGKLARLSGN